MTERSRNIVVGAVTLTGLVGLGFILFLFGYVPRLLETGYFVTLELTDAASLNVGSRVELAGIDIGQVETIDFKQPLGTGVTVALRLREEVMVPTNTVVQVDKPIIGGSPTIRFVIDADTVGPPADFLATDGSAVVTGSPGALATIFEQVDRLADSVDALSAEWQAVGQKVNGLLEAQDLEAVEAGEVPGNLTTAVARIDRRLAEFRAVVAGADALVNDPKLREDLAATAANARQTTADVGRSLERLEKRYVALADEVAVAVGQVNVLMKSANAAEGTVGKLVNDPALYDNLNDTAERLGTVVDELRLLLEKWKAEGVPISL